MSNCPSIHFKKRKLGVPLDAFLYKFGTLIDSRQGVVYRYLFQKVKIQGRRFK